MTTLFASPLIDTTLYQLGPLPITSGLATSWALIAAITLAAFLATRKLTLVLFLLERSVYGIGELLYLLDFILLII